jgi:hypothetical protein
LTKFGDGLLVTGAGGADFRYRRRVKSSVGDKPSLASAWRTPATACVTPACASASRNRASLSSIRAITLPCRTNCPTFADTLTTLPAAFGAMSEVSSAIKLPVACTNAGISRPTDLSTVTLTAAFSFARVALEFSRRSLADSVLLQAEKDDAIKMPINVFKTIPRLDKLKARIKFRLRCKVYNKQLNLKTLICKFL